MSTRFLRSHFRIGNFLASTKSSVRCGVRSYGDIPDVEETKTEFFQLSNGDKLAYKKMPGNNLPGIIFLPGYMGDMTEQKAVILERYCKIYDHPFIRFDYRSVGESAMADESKISLDEWISDALTVLDTLTHPSDPQILVGSSLGAFIMWNVAIKRPERLFGLVGVSAVYSLPEELKNLPDEPMDIHTKNHHVTGNFLKAGRRIFTDFHATKTVPIRCPVRLLHGMLDDTIPYKSTAELIPRVESDDVQLILSKSGEHRMSKPQDLQLLVNTVDQLVKLYDNPYPV